MFEGRIEVFFGYQKLNIIKYKKINLNLYSLKTIYNRI